MASHQSEWHAVPTDGPRPIVVVGPARGGTTWTGQVLDSAPGTQLLIEPDNEDKYPGAIRGKRRLGRYPVLEPDEEGGPYREMWDWILHDASTTPRIRLARRLLSIGDQRTKFIHPRYFQGRRDPAMWAIATIGVSRRARPHQRPPGRRVIAKSVHAQLALEWLSSEFEVDVVVLLRHPANVLASWKAVNFKDGRFPSLERNPRVLERYVRRWGVDLPGEDTTEQICWRIALLTAALEEAAARHPEWHLMVHEETCVDPDTAFRNLFSALDLPWTEPTEAYLREHDLPGTGFQIRRVASTVADSWRRSLTDEELDCLTRVIEQFPIRRWRSGDFTR